MKNSASGDDSSQEASSTQTHRGASDLQAMTAVPRLYAGSASLTVMALSVTVWRSVHSGAGMLVEVAHRLQVQRHTLPSREAPSPCSFPEPPEEHP